MMRKISNRFFTIVLYNTLRISIFVCLFVFCGSDDAHCTHPHASHSPSTLSDKQNIRVIAKYYSRISSKRLSQFLSVSEADTERYLSEMVTAAEIYARIDRLDGIVQFRKKETANSLLNDWRSDTIKLLDLVDLTCHQIHKEMMIHSTKNAKRKSGAR